MRLTTTTAPATTRDGSSTPTLVRAAGVNPCDLLTDAEVSKFLGAPTEACELTAVEPTADTESLGPSATYRSKSGAMIFFQLATTESLALNPGLDLTLDELYDQLEENMPATLPGKVGQRSVSGLSPDGSTALAQSVLDDDRSLMVQMSTGGKDITTALDLLALLAERWT